MVLGRVTSALTRIAAVLGQHLVTQEAARCPSRTQQLARKCRGSAGSRRSPPATPSLWPAASSPPGPGGLGSPQWGCPAPPLRGVPLVRASGVGVRPSAMRRETTWTVRDAVGAVSYTHLRAHETV